jgi:hypothetical protein
MVKLLSRYLVLFFELLTKIILPYLINMEGEEGKMFLIYIFEVL